MAIEFAFFGLGSDSGSSVLKLGEDSGEVRMVFEVDGAGYEVTRRLTRKSGKVQQSDGVLKTPMETLNLSPSELKEKVLEVLEFNEAPDPKAQSWIYRYAVYTPQEEMKNILALAPEQRLQILRRAFRVEDYKTAATNAEEAMRQIRLDASKLEGISEGVDELRKQVEMLQQDKEKHKEALTGFEAAVSKAEEEAQQLRAEKEKLQKKELGLQGTKSEREYYERLGSDASKDAGELRVDLEDVRGRILELDSAMRESAATRPPSTKTPSELKRKERAAETKVRELVGLKAALESKLSDYESIIRNGVCPVCDRPAEAHDFESKRGRKESERRHVAEELESEERALAELRQWRERAEEYAAEKKQLARQRTEKSRLKDEAGRKEAALLKLEKRGAFAEATLQQIGAQLEELKGVVEQGRKTGRALNQAEDSFRRAREDLVRAKERLEAVQKRQTEIAIEIVAKEEASNKSGRLRERELWLGDYFVPTVKVIEKSVLATINQEFDSLFKRWFGMLVADPDKEVGVDEDFTPAVTQGGYEQDVRYLSGGERTSVALAYRLALNILAQRVSAGMKSSLLILDEPTDGFSKEQLGNVREVLDEVGCPQVIIVSHDKELESFADQIFRVVKAGSESSVKTP